MHGNRKQANLFEVNCCLMCGNPNIHWHHIFYGTANRKISDQYGYIAPLCMKHHTGPDGVHFNRELDLKLKRYAEEHFIKNYGTKEDFIRTFGKSYL